jgi:hypothetical protein
MRTLGRHQELFMIRPSVKLDNFALQRSSRIIEMLSLVVTCFFLCLLAAAAPAPAATKSSYTEVFYGSGNLSIQAYLYQPYGSGPFPVVIYNHGARRGGERRSVPQLYIG